MFYRYSSNLGLLVLTSVGAMGRCLFFFLKIITVHAGFFHSLGIKEPPVPVSICLESENSWFRFQKVIFLKQKFETGSGYQKNHGRTGKSRRFS